MAGDLEKSSFVILESPPLSSKFKESGEASPNFFLKKFGEVSERLNEHAWKACGRSNVSLGFESRPLRHLNEAEFPRLSG